MLGLEHYLLVVLVGVQLLQHGLVVLLFPDVFLSNVQFLLRALDVRLLPGVFLADGLEEALLLLQDLLLLLDAGAEGLGFLLQFLLLLLLVNFLLARLLDHLVQLLHVVDVLDDLHLAALALVRQVFVELPHLVQFLVLVFPLLAQLFVAFAELAELAVLFEVGFLLGLALEDGDLALELADALALLLFFLALVLDFLVGLADLGFEGGDLFDFVGGHADGGADVGGFLEDLVVEVLALLDELLFSVVGGLERFVNLLVLVLELVQVLVPNDFLQELLELPLDVLEALGVEAEGVDFLGGLGFVLDGV